MSHPEPSADDVRDIMDTSLDDASLEAHIDASSYAVEDVKANDSSISDARLTDLHTWLAAYYASAQERRLSSQSGESRSLSYATEDSAGYLETAIRLDPTGIIAQQGKPKATLSVPDVKDLG